VRTATPTVPGAPTNTATPVGPSPTGGVRTATRTPQSARTATPTNTVPSGTTLAQAIGSGETTIIVNNGNLLPESGTLLIDSERIRFQGRTGNTLLNVIRGVDGTARASHSAGASVTLVETPTPTNTVPGGPSIIDYSSTAEGASCSMTSGPTANPFLWASMAVAALIGVRRRRP